MLDSKTSCLIRGIMGVIFGCLALSVPREVPLGFYGLFWILIGFIMARFLFLAITARGYESVLWSGLSAALFLTGVISFMVPEFVAVIPVLTVAVIAILNGFCDITLAPGHPKPEYILIPGTVITAILMTGVLFYSLTGFWNTRFLSVVRTCALILGFFSIFGRITAHGGAAEGGCPVLRVATMETGGRPDGCSPVCVGPPAGKNRRVAV
jgi:hypothetical protein